MVYTSDEPAGERIANVLQATIDDGGSPDALDQLHDLLSDQPTLDIADTLTERLRTRDLPVDGLRRVSRWLAEHGNRRNAVATGIVLLGLTGDERDRDLLLLLGALEDLALYAVVALRRSQSDPERAVFELARRVDGWDRIHCVERLDGTNDPEIKAWLLRDGFRNGVLNGYLAHLAATTGGLYTALLESQVDDALLDGAGDILDALCTLDGSAKDIRAYPDGPAVIHRYLDLLSHRPPTLDRIHAVLRLARFPRIRRRDGPGLELVRPRRRAREMPRFDCPINLARGRGGRFGQRRPPGLHTSDLASPLPAHPQP